MAGNGLNALDIVEDLQKEGVSEGQAKVFARVLLQISDNTAATKQDLEMSKIELKRDIEAFRAELKRDIEETRAEFKRDIKDLDLKIENVRKDLDLKIEVVKKDLKIWMGGMAFLSLSALVALAKMGLLTP